MGTRPVYFLGFDCHPTRPMCLLGFDWLHLHWPGVTLPVSLDSCTAGVSSGTARLMLCLWNLPTTRLPAAR